MSLSGGFRKSAERQRQEAAKEQPKRLPPFSLRLSDEERQMLIVEADGAPLGTYIKAKVLGDARPLRMRRTGGAVEDRQALGQVLAMLGRSRLASNLTQLAHLAHVGALALTPETEAELREAYRDIRDIRRLLLTALGMRPEDGP